jgi:hypothetical protein
MFFKILLFPISLILTVFVALSSFLVEKCAIILNIISGLSFIFSALIFLQYFFGWPFGEAGISYDLFGGCLFLALAFILSPFGLPTAMMWVINKLDILNQSIKSI